MPDSVWPTALARTLGVASPAAGAEALTLRLFHELRQPLLRYLAALGVAPSDGEDILQEAFLALFRHVSSTSEPGEQLRAWLYRVARNLALKHLSRLAARPVAGLEAEALAAPEADPEAAAGWNQHARRVRSVVAALPELDRQVLLLRGEGLRYRDIAQVLGVSLGTVAQCLARALHRVARATEKG